MKDILLLLVLLIAQLTKVYSQPYQADSDGKCSNPNTEYLLEGSNLCCKKCQPGQRLAKECSESNETVCEKCGPGLYMENWNYASNCFSCIKCKLSKGLQPAQNCTATSRGRCTCNPGMYCNMGVEDCEECRKYKSCPVGYGVSTPGTANSNVKCKKCPDGTFSDTESHTDPCWPHTNCHGRAVVRKGNATSDTLCASTTTQSQTSTKDPHPEIVLTTTRTMSPLSTPAWGLTYSTQSVVPSVSELVFNKSTKALPADTVTGIKLAAVITGVTVFLLLFFVILLLLLCKTIKKKDAERLNPKVDTNGNCESGDKINRGYVGEAQLTSLTVTSPEQQCLLEKGEASSDHSQCSNNTETLTRTEGCSSHGSTDPLQSTLALNSSCSALSEPMPLISNTEPVTPQPSVFTQSSSQPTSPQIISPVTTSPHVNVNITFHIGNGTCGTPSVMPTDLIKTDCKLPFGEEEESFSIPQQEDGKQSLMSVQESTCTSYMHEESPA